jgi:TniQ
MITVKPMPNELAAGHEGRLMWLNGCNFYTKLSTVNRDGGEAKNPLANQPKLHQLAMLSDMTATEYARQHSMLAVLRVAAKPGADLIHGSPGSISYSRLQGMLTQRHGAYCCTQCIKEDLQFWGFTWYRRTHHLIGVDWCPSHGIRLSRIDDKSAFNAVPHRWFEQGKLVGINACQTHMPDQGFLRRYVDIALALLQRDRPFTPQQINGCLAHRASELGLRSSRDGTRKLLSDKLIEMAPKAWLNMHVSDWTKKEYSQQLLKVDGVIAKKHEPVSGEAYAIALAALYDSPDDALRAVASYSPTKVQVPISQTKTKYEQTFWQGEVWPHYVASRGNMTELAKRLQVSREHLSEMLVAAGLPCLRGLDGLAKWRALERFSEGQSLSTACAAEQVPCDELEELLRKCSFRVTIAIKQINRPRSFKSTVAVFEDPALVPTSLG